jgi:hypothetical protein
MRAKKLKIKAEDWVKRYQDLLEIAKMKRVKNIVHLNFHTLQAEKPGK